MPQVLIVYKKVKFFLIFFCVILFASCNKKPHSENIKVNYKDGKAISVTYKATSSLEYSIYLKDNDLAPLLGSTQKENNTITFSPIVPFTPSSTYEIREKGKVVSNFTIRTTSENKKPELLAIYPSTDTVPENLLKMYFVFSEPMQYTKSALEFIKVFDENTQQEVDVFLELQSELWNKEHTQLTLWLDPGRIKTDLIPNREKGLPILKNHTYTISIDSQWSSAEGKPLSKKYEKQITVGGRDVNKPNPKEWSLSLPNKNTSEPLHINFNEPMDAVLVMETFQIENRIEEKLNGTFSLSSNEKKLMFHPEQKWKEGDYTIYINPVLEDLAGNNLHRLFDTDLSKQDHIGTEVVDPLKFSIQ